MNPVADTAYYCCGIRREDAKKENSLCNDIYAERFMDERGSKIFEPFSSEKMQNISNITRCRLIDDFLQAELNRNSDTKIISIGAGFDSRPYRLTGGRWVEVDEPQLMAIKDERLPVNESPNPLRRIPIEFDRESLADKLADESEEGTTLFVIEGVFMYLDQAAAESTLATLQALFPRHVIYCDLMSRRFFNRFTQSVYEKIVAAGARFSERPEAPEEMFTANHYRLVERVPTFKRATELGLLWREAGIPSFASWLMLNVFMQDLKGYAVHRFDFEKA